MTDGVFNLTGGIGQCSQRCGRAAGFTAVELLMALSICSIVMLALSAIMTSVAQGWTHSENTQGYSIAESTGMLRVERVLRQCRLVGAHSTGSISGSAMPAYMVFWSHDGQPNDTIEVSEVAILEHDPVSRTVRVWEVSKPSQLHEQEISEEVLRNSGNIKAFTRMPGVRARTLAVNVEAMGLWVHEPTMESEHQVIEFALKFDRPARRGSRGATTATLYGNATRRVPGDSSTQEQP